MMNDFQRYPDHYFYFLFSLNFLHSDSYHLKKFLQVRQLMKIEENVVVDDGVDVDVADGKQKKRARF